MPDLHDLSGTPWSTRTAAGPDGRPALEIYEAGLLVDVMVARSLAPRILRGARAAVWSGRSATVAWGCLPASGSLPVVVVTRRRRRPLIDAAEAVSLGGWFWIALADGHFAGVTVAILGSREQHTMRTTRSHSARLGVSSLTNRPDRSQASVKPSLR
ncbi:MAG TPA: hypothetical protein VMU94_18525 [Streptosporangiaceae bacterium]|nr:hypothetical protein [Streptosporangiaceae bacterium]